MAIRPLLLGLAFLLALVLIILSMLLIDTSRPAIEPGAFSPSQTDASPQH